MYLSGCSIREHFAGFFSTERMLWVLKVTVFQVSQHVLVGDVMKVIGVIYLLICMSVLL